MPAIMENPGLSLNISAVERDTGLSKDVLRVWERRYGFPAPLRDDNGERLYPPQQVERLRAIRRLMDAGHRPGRLLTMADAELLALARPHAPPPAFAPAAAGPLAAAAAEVDALLGAACACDGGRLGEALTASLLRRGLPAFVHDVMLPLLERSDDARLRGDMAPLAGQLCREQLRRTLQAARGMLAAADSGERRALAVLATLPQDGDDLHLLAAEALLLGEGMRCLSLGMQVPVADIAAAARRLPVAAVVPSFAATLSPKIALASLQALRDALPAETAVWAIGALIPRLRREIPGVTLLPAVDDIRQCAKGVAINARSAGMTLTQRSMGLSPPDYR